MKSWLVSSAPSPRAPSFKKSPRVCSLTFEPLRPGAAGPRVRELHERLTALGLGPARDVDTYDADTVALVEACQRSRGLPLSGVVDRTTWERLDEARWRLGDRLLFLSEPWQRGDDVADLQVALTQLGFRPGRIDGIFGPQTDEALREFQQNRALGVNGVLAKATWHELLRVRATHLAPDVAASMLEIAEHREETSGVVLLCGRGALARALEKSLGTSEHVRVLLDVTDDDAASQANQLGVDLVLSVVEAGTDAITLYYWSGYRTHSRRGEVLASSLASDLARLPLAPPLEVKGMALPILRETRMTTVHVEHGTLAEQALHEIVTTIHDFLSAVIHSARA